MSDDTIYRQAAFESVHSLFKPLPQYLADKMNVGYNHALADTLATLKALPSAERRGRWIEEYSENHFQAKCSACGESTLYGITYDLEGNAYYMNYCPNCGARMEGEEE